jgi:hypothetical protein
MTFAAPPSVLCCFHASAIRARTREGSREAVDDYIRSAQEGLVNFSFLTDATRTAARLPGNIAAWSRPGSPESIQIRPFTAPIRFAGQRLP